MSDENHHMRQHRQNDRDSVRYEGRFDEYWVPAGNARQQLFYCPWCGVKLPELKDDLWFEELKARGIEDPFKDKRRIPKEFRTSEWWIKRGL